MAAVPTPRHLLLVCLLVQSAAAGGRSARCQVAEGRLHSACDAPSTLQLFSSRAGALVKCDQHVDKQDFEAPPIVRFTAANQGSLYTLVMVDPDVPGHGQGRFWLHWMITNIPGRDFAAGVYASANVVAEYVRPAPPPGSRAHRYLLLVYLQTSGRVQVQLPEQRPQFPMAAFMQRFYPGCLAGPVAGTQFRAAY